MNAHDALQVVLVKSFETQGTQSQLLPDAERRHATRAAFEAVGAGGTADAFIAARAKLAIEGITKQTPIVTTLLRSDGWHTTWLLMAIGAGLLLGITADVFGSGRELNLLAPPAWLVMVWNLGVYVILCGRLFAAGADKVLPATGWIARGVHSLMDLRMRRSTSSVANSAAHVAALADFGVEWTRVSLPLTAARVKTLLHAASAAVAIALIAGMYLRGVALEYRVGWSSTFLQAETVHGLLSFLLAPAACVSGIALPDVQQLATLRDASGLSREQASAAPWIHLYAVMLLLVVVVPRTLMALWSGWRSQRLGAHFPLSLDDSYYRSLRRVQRGEPTRVLLLPYGQGIGESAQQHLQDLLVKAFDDSPTVELAATIALGAEDDLADLASTLARATHLVAVFDMTATPEAEYHGAFLTGLQSAVKVPVIIVINESSFAHRFRDYPQRLSERRQAWSRFAGSVAKKALFLDLEKPQDSWRVSELNVLIDDVAEAHHG